MNNVDLIGKTFHRLLVMSKAPSHKKRACWHCFCECGNLVVVNTSSLKTGNTKSCGCWNRQAASKRAKKQSFRHGHSGGHGKTGLATGTYRSWSSMRSRCNNPKTTQYYNYGGRGITVCDRWQGEDGFINFLSDVGERPKGKTLDRIDVNKNYELGNVRWSTPQVQISNRRPYKSLDNFSNEEIAEEFFKRELDKRGERVHPPQSSVVVN